MSVEQKGDTMTEGRGLLTEREREAIEGDSSDSYRYKTRTYVRRRLDKLEADADLLAEHEPDLYDRLLDAVDTDAVDPVDIHDENADSDTRADAVDDATDGPADGDAVESGRAREESGALDDVLDGWVPDTEANAEAARAQTRRAVEYLAATGDRLTRSDLVDALAGDSSLGDRSWWERAVQPGLRRLADADLVEYRAGFHDYRWIGDDAVRAHLNVE